MSASVAGPVARFVEEMLALLRREFFVGHSDKRFYQERPTLIQAITWPARWLNERGARFPASRYRRILETVIATIKRHGTQVRFRQFSLYFFKSVQEHMNHHGDQYYYEAKVRPIAALLPRATTPGARHLVDPATNVLSQVNAVLRSKGGRRRLCMSATESDLFAIKAGDSRKTASVFSPSHPLRTGSNGKHARRSDIRSGPNRPVRRSDIRSPLPPPDGLGDS